MEKTYEYYPKVSYRFEGKMNIEKEKKYQVRVNYRLLVLNFHFIRIYCGVLQK